LSLGIDEVRVSSATTPAAAVPSAAPPDFTRRLTWLAVRERLIGGVLLCCALISVLTTLAIILVLSTEAFAFFREASLWEFLTGTQWTPQYADKHYGILPLLTGTLMVAGIASLIGIPIGLASALYLSEYSSPRTRNIVKPILEILAGVPSVVYGYFALIFVTPYLLRPIFSGWLGLDVQVFNAASGGIVVGIMIIPMISSLSEDVLRAVPRGLREAAYALGSTKFDVSVRVVLPAALSGVLASFLLAFSRAIGETMVVAIAVGNNPALTVNPFVTMETMTAYIVNVSMGDTPAGSVEYLSLYAVAAALFLITLMTNIAAQFIMRRYREVYQ
jgi:phosphate transport system permease protein